MATSLFRLLLIAQFQIVFNTPAPLGNVNANLDMPPDAPLDRLQSISKRSIHNPSLPELAKQSPIDAKSDHLLRQPPHQMLKVPAKKASRKKKAPFIPVQHQYLIPQHLLVIPAHSNVHHSSVHTDVTHLTSGNHRIPVVSQTVHHSSTNITHPGLVSILVPDYHKHLTQQNVYLHDLSVIPLRHPGHDQKGNHQVQRAAASGRSQYEQASYIPIPYYGGYGNGLHFGGHGAGHGFHVTYNFR